MSPALIIECRGHIIMFLCHNVECLGHIDESVSPNIMSPTHNNMS